MKADILLKIADYLESDVKDENFYLGHWKKDEECGTTACAIGHTCHLIPGLELKLYGYSMWEPVFVCGDREYVSQEAIALALDIPEEDVFELFYSDGYGENPTRYDVAKKIRKYVVDEQVKESLQKHEEDYKPQAWEEYTLAELGNFVHLLVKRSKHRSDPEKRKKDLYDADNYLNMMRAQLEKEKTL